MSWLVRDEEVLSSLEVAQSFRARFKGLLGRRGIRGAIWIHPCRSVHTFGMRFSIDVAFLDADQVVIRVLQMRPNRLSRPYWKARSVVEAEAGTFASWELAVGDELEIRR